ncbi:MAG: FkbM family methyltransferase [Spirochaetia bacterium]|nr:FkbM family methyltransferase [Spirochaetia bacterium]
MSVIQKILNKIWGLGASLANMAQRHKLLNSRARTVFRKLGHLLIPKPKERMTLSLPWKMKIITPPGFRGGRSYTAGVYEEDLTNLFKKIIKQSDTVVDCGALLGYYTLLASSLAGPEGKVYSFEPEAKSCEYLKENIEINKLKNVICVNKALSEKTGFAQFASSESKSIGTVGGFLSYDENEENTNKIETVSFDDYFKKLNWPPVDFIKMDIDGAEKYALLGMKQLSKKNSKLKMVMEVDHNAIKNSKSNPKELCDILMGLGFRKGFVVEKKLQEFSLKDGFLYLKSHYNVLLTKE